MVTPSSLFWNWAVSGWITLRVEHTVTKVRSWALMWTYHIMLVRTSWQVRSFTVFDRVPQYHVWMEGSETSCSQALSGDMIVFGGAEHDVWVNMKRFPTSGRTQSVFKRVKQSVKPSPKMYQACAKKAMQKALQLLWVWTQQQTIAGLYPPTLLPQCPTGVLR